MVFTIHDCGFAARLAVEDTGASELRLDKIVRIIRESRYSIHDISRVELGKSKLPRFNMAFEAGLAMGAIRFASARTAQARDLLLLDAIPHRDKITLSDLAGQDAKTHENRTDGIIKAVRTFLAAKARGVRTVRGASAIIRRYNSFVRDLPKLAKNVDLTVAELNSFDYLADRIGLMAQWLKVK